MKTGIDISSHQGAVNWGKVVADFAILRAGWSWYDGGMNIDKRFLQNVAGAREVGVPWGAYLYAYDRTPAAARVSAERLADLLDQFQLPYPVAYDFEDTQYLGTGRESNTAICKAFLETLQGRGYYVMLYTYTNFAKGYLDMAGLAAYDLWIADYTGQVGWPGEYGIWQYSGSGRAPGVAGQVDLDRAYRDYPAIIRAAGLNGYGRRPLPPRLRRPAPGEPDPPGPPGGPGKAAGFRPGQAGGDTADRGGVRGIPLAQPNEKSALWKNFHRALQAVEKLSPEAGPAGQEGEKV